MGCPNQHFSVVVGRQDICHVAPGSPPGGYRIACRADGSGGVYQVCRDRFCSQCDVATVEFSNDQCVPNGDAAITGAASVNFRCSVPLPLPQPPPIFAPPAVVVMPTQAPPPANNRYQQPRNGWFRQ